MFVLAEMKHVIRTPPHMFHLKLNDAISEELNKKLANKVYNSDPLISRPQLQSYFVF
jgi:DNA-directed RNA polymerase subunit E'/Rpb7